MDREIDDQQYARGVAMFDMTWLGTEINEQLYMQVNYCTKLFKQETIQRFSSCFKTILRAVLKNPRLKIAEIEILTEEEKGKILYDFNDTETVYPQNKTIHELFSRQAQRTPDHTALVGVEGTRELTAIK
jgi:non-ribosomal peptide synthetase component F